MLGRVLLVGAIAIAIAAAAPRAGADVTQTLKGGAIVDWSRGVITARGIGPADRHAPSPAVARDAARVRAQDAARARLTAAARELPGVARDLADAALARAVGRATVASMDVGTDGSVTIELALPIEAVRVAGAGPRRAEPAGDDAPAVVIVDARAVKLRPAVGVELAGKGGAAAWVGPVLFVDAIPGDADPRIAPRAVRVTATKVESKGGGRTIVVDGDLPAAGALAVVVIGGM